MHAYLSRAAFDRDQLAVGALFAALHVAEPRAAGARSGAARALGLGLGLDRPRVRQSHVARAPLGLRFRVSLRSGRTLGNLGTKRGLALVELRDPARRGVRRLRVGRHA